MIGEVFAQHPWLGPLAWQSTILSDPGAARYVDGTAFHHYQGKPSAMTTLSDRFPGKRG